MTPTAWVLAGVAALAAGLIAWALLDDRPDPAEPRQPAHAKWTQGQETRRLHPGPPSARAEVLKPSEVFLVPEPGEDEWRFPPYPGDR